MIIYVVRLGGRTFPAQFRNFVAEDACCAEPRESVFGRHAAVRLFVMRVKWAFAHEERGGGRRYKVLKKYFDVITNTQ